MHQLEFLLALLERLPTGLRHGLLDAACREQPTLQHPKLAHDPIALNRLVTLPKQSASFKSLTTRTTDAMTQARERGVFTSLSDFFPPLGLFPGLRH